MLIQKRFLILLSLIIYGNSYSQVVINEFSAHKGIYDENNIESDWIEIYNNSNQAENLSGFYLTDNLNELEKWPLPHILLMPYQRITFFASGKNIEFNDGLNDFYHTNFKLSPSEY
ncbi:MAG: lamin tail domain-containing protein, partial [Flavobacteriales bacterium]